MSLSLNELYLRVLPEALLYIYALYVLINRKIEIKRYILTSLLLCLYIFFVRSLPIEKYVHTILFLIGYILIAEKLVKIKMFKAISLCMITVILLLLSEILNMMLVSLVFRIPLAEVEGFISQDTFTKILYGLPSLLILLLSILIIKYLNKFIKKSR